MAKSCNNLFVHNTSLQTSNELFVHHLWLTMKHISTILISMTLLPHNFFYKGLYYLKGLSITPGLCIARCTQPTNRKEKYHRPITNHKILHSAYGSGPIRRSRCHPCGVKMSLAVVSSRADTSVKKSRNSTHCNMDHERSKLMHRRNIFIV